MHILSSTADVFQRVARDLQALSRDLYAQAASARDQRRIFDAGELQTSAAAMSSRARAYVFSE